MNIDGLHAWRKLGVVTAICLIAAVGEMRGSGSQAIASTAPSEDVVTTAATTSQVAAEIGGTPQMIGADADGPSHSTEAKDDAHLVPAIYAWDPDVRFVYFRHVSKWM